MNRIARLVVPLAVLCLGTVGCTYHFPNSGQDGVFGCQKDDQCLAGFICEANLCVRGVRGVIDYTGTCDLVNWIVSPAEAISPSTVLPGASVQLIADNVPDNPDDPCARFAATWWICLAPATSSFASSDADGCQHQVANDGQNSLAFVPDRAGSYTIELRRRTDVQRFVVTAACAAVTLSVAPTSGVVPGTLVTATVASLPAAPNDCGVANASWWVCDAPAGSALSSPGEPCRAEGAGMASLPLTPDLPGTYRVELRRPGGRIDEAQVKVICAHTAVTTTPADGRIYAGLPLLAQASALPGSGICSASGATWWICPGVEVDCALPSLATSCTEDTTHRGQASMIFTPTTRGPYTAELCRLGQTDSAPVTALADALFSEVSFMNPALMRQIMAATNGDTICYGHADSTSCAADSAHNCAWDTNFQLCWDTCTYGVSGDCTATGHGCDWTTVCARSVNELLACMFKTDATACGLVQKAAGGGAACRWDTVTATCQMNVDCTNPALTTQPLCEAAGCGWLDGRCVDPTSFALPEYTYMQIYADGSQVAPLVYRNTNPVYRFDPNNVFAGVGVRAGTGQAGSGFGLGSDLGDAVAAIPHTYLYTRPGTPMQCAPAQTVVFWKQGATLGAPAATVSLLDVQSNLLSALDVPTPGLPATVGYPQLLRRAAGSYRVVFGKAPIASPSLSACESANVTGAQYRDMVFAMMPFVMSSAATPLSDLMPMEIWVADVDTTVAPATRTGGALEAPAGVYPCATDSDCPSQAAGSCTLATGTCTGVYTVQGYLPRLVAQVAEPGRAILFSHVTCAGGYGSACTAGSSGVDYDLVAARLQAGSNTQLESASFIAADPGVREVEAFVSGDLFNLASVYYLGISPSAHTVSTLASGPQNVDVPLFGLYKVSTSFSNATKKWTTTTSPAVLVTGSAREVVDPEFTAVPCRLGGVAGMTLTSTWEATNPIHFVMSPDRRYLAYARAVQRLECVSTFSLGTPTDVLKPGAPTASDVYVIDTQSGSATPVPVYAPSCVTGGTLRAINLMPIFISNSQQLVFASGPAGSSMFATSHFFRFNLADLNAVDPGCRVVEVASSAALTTALTSQVSSKLVPLGAGLADSRTYVKPACSCNGGLSERSAWLVAVLGAAAWWRRRRGEPGCT